jgi:hypothetical protein
VSRARLHSGSHVVGHDDDEELGEDEIEETEFFAQRGAVNLDFGLGLLHGRNVCVSQVAFGYAMGSQGPRPFDFSQGKLYPAKLWRNKDGHPLHFFSTGINAGFSSRS